MAFIKNKSKIHLFQAKKKHKLCYPIIYFILIFFIKKNIVNNNKFNFSGDFKKFLILLFRLLIDLAITFATQQSSSL